MKRFPLHIEPIDVMLLLALSVVAAVWLLTGCARFSTVQQDESLNKDGTSRTITTRAKAATFFAGKSVLANWKATQTDKTQGASVGSLTQDVNATNATALVEAAVGAAVRAAVGVAK